VNALLGIDLTDRLVLVAGGGPVAARRVLALLAAGAKVRVVAPELCEDLAELAAAGDVTWRAGEPAEADLSGAWLVHALTGDPGTDAALARWAEQRRTWCVAGAAGELGSARTPAVTRHGDVLVGVVAVRGRDDGAGAPVAADPGRAAAVRDDLAAHLRAGRGDLRRGAPSGAPGTVTLVGGGPGDVELLTVRGRRALAEADVVVADRLGPRAVLAELRPGVEVVDVGKAPGHHPVPQEEINRILVERAQRGQAVVRLKGGDPYLLGRGGEEVLACREAGVPVVVVPGVSSALAVPAAAGIPVTHRGTATSLHVVTGHDGLDEPSLLALRQRSGTVVVLMGVTTLPHLVAQALAAGADPATPVAIVENGTLPAQRVTRAPLGRVVAAAGAARVKAPAVVVVGDVADPTLLEAGPRAGQDGSPARFGGPNGRAEA
jgi:uroporphyrin-III C-methyltransferase/precorrin-2 dehydrogenase/sirohydrochlorin ferrochelatase